MSENHFLAEADGSKDKTTKTKPVWREPGIVEFPISDIRSNTNGNVGDADGSVHS